MECAIELETSPALSLWHWYAGAIQQYHYALLILIEIYAFPMRKEADRIWRCLDYIFDVPQGLTRDQKGRWIITQVRDKTGYYMGVRKARAPARIDGFNQQLPSPAASSASPPLHLNGDTKTQKSKLRPTVATTQVPFGQSASASYITPTTPSVPNQLPLPGGQPIMAAPPDAPMVDIDWVSPYLSLASEV